jgi:Fic family protein
MDITPFKLKRLPVSIDWKKIIPLLGDARALIARLSEFLRQHPCGAILYEPLKWQESIATLHAQKSRSFFFDLFQYRFELLAETHEEQFKAGTSPVARQKLIENIGELPPKILLLQKIIAAKEALDTAINWGNSQKIGAAFFCRIHSGLEKNIIPHGESGKIRTRQNWIGARGCRIEDAYFYPPSPQQIRPLLKNLENYLLGRDLDPLVQIAIAFAQLLMIHPFMDGNGRIARISVPILAMRKGLLSAPILFLSEYFEAHRLAYFQKLFHVSETDAWEEWILFFLAGVIEQTNRYYRRMQSLKRLWKKTVLLSNERIATRLFQQPVFRQGAIAAEKALETENMLTAQSNQYWRFNPLMG